MDLSIIIPCYNSEKYLKNCLNSFCNQIKRYNKIEVILVNDSSTDGTSKILKSYGKKFKFIKILKNKKNLGVSLSRNLAINRSRGNYILFLDSDDYYQCPIEKPCRSIMNVVFRLPTLDLEEIFIEKSEKEGLVNLKGHRSVGGCRASIYNAMPKSGVEGLADFMREFRESHPV